MGHRELINLWPSISAFADDIGVRYETAKAMRRRGSIPSQYWKLAVEAAQHRGIAGVDYENLAELVAVTACTVSRHPEAAE